VGMVKMDKDNRTVPVTSGSFIQFISFSFELESGDSSRELVTNARITLFLTTNYQKQQELCRFLDFYTRLLVPSTHLIDCEGLS
jgi:hypothetical protein